MADVNGAEFCPYPLRIYCKDLASLRRRRRDEREEFAFGGRSSAKVALHGVVVVGEGGERGFDLADVTATVRVYCSKADRESTQNRNFRLKRSLDLTQDRGQIDPTNADTLRWMLDTVEKHHNWKPTVGDIVSVIGIPITDDVDRPSFLAVELVESSLEMDLIWMMELNMIYETRYFKCR